MLNALIKFHLAIITISPNSFLSTRLTMFGTLKQKICRKGRIKL